MANQKQQSGKRDTLFITGTDTGVGKTLLTGMLLCHLRDRGRRVAALKPFCSGSRGDTTFLSRVQHAQLPAEQITPYFFSEPLAPFVAARKTRTRIRLNDVLAKLNDAAAGYDSVLIEGSGGLLVPLGSGFNALDLIIALKARVILVAKNKLGVINHTLLTVCALGGAGVRQIKVVLMNQARPDASAATNRFVLSQLLDIPVLDLPYLGRFPKKIGVFEKNCKNFAKDLAEVMGYY